MPIKIVIGYAEYANEKTAETPHNIRRDEKIPNRDVGIRNIFTAKKGFKVTTEPDVEKNAEAEEQHTSPQYISGLKGFMKCTIYSSNVEPVVIVQNLRDYFRTKKLPAT